MSYRRMSHKLVEWSFEHVMAQNDDLSCYELSQKDVEILLQIVPQAEWLTRWRGASESDLDGIQGMVATTVNRLLAPSDSCIDTGDCPTGSLGTCYRQDARNETWDLSPNNPYVDLETFTFWNSQWRTMEQALASEFVPDWLQQLNDEYGEVLGYRPNDLVSWFGFNQVGSDALSRIAELLLTFDLESLYPMPTVTWKLRGTGQFEVQFLNFPFGGACILTWDIELNREQFLDIINGNLTDLDNVTVIELGRDAFQFPPELVTTVITEIEFTEDIEHTVRALFFPRINDSLPFLFPFVGIREIELCGLEILGTNSGTVYGEKNFFEQRNLQNGAIDVTSVNDLCEGVYCGMRKFFKDAIAGGGDGTASNTTSNVELTTDGIIKIVRDTIEIPPPEATDEERRYGGAKLVSQNVNEFFENLRSFTQNNPDDATVELYIGSIYIVFDSIDVAIQTMRAGITDGALASPVPSIDFAAALYCDGISSNTLSEVVLDTLTDDVVIPAYLRAFSALSPEQLGDWFVEGGNTPSTEFLGAPCYRNATITFSPTISQLQASRSVPIPDAYSYDNTRNFRLEFSGLITLTDGRTFDGLFLEDTNGTRTALQGRLRTDRAFNLWGSWGTNNTVKVGGKLIAEITPPNTGANTLLVAVELGISDTDLQLVDTSTLQIDLVDLGQP